MYTCSYAISAGPIWVLGMHFMMLTPKDTNHNVIINSNTVLYNCKDSIILVPEGQLAVVQDLDGYLVASRDNVLLICKKDDHDAIRKFVNDVEMKFGEKYS